MEGLSLGDFVLDFMRGAVEKVLETSGAEEISLFGQSQGGTLCAMYASLFPEGPLKNLVLLSTPTEVAPRTPRGTRDLWASGRSLAATAGRSSIRRWSRGSWATFPPISPARLSTLQHRVRPAQRLGQVGLLGSAFPDRGYDHPLPQPGQGIRLPRCRSRRHARGSRGRRPLASRSGLARAPLLTPGDWPGRFDLSTPSPDACTRRLPLRNRVARPGARVCAGAWG